MVAADTLQLAVSGVPATATVLWFQGTGMTNGGAGVALGDGLRCAGGSLIRLGSQLASGGVASFPGAGSAAISELGLVPAAGALRTYQAWYRDPAAFCTGETYNLTNGVRVQWIP
jgi:hypothetical protein